MDDSEAMINQLRDRSMSEVTLAQVAAATKKVIDNPRLEDAMCKSIRGLSTGGTQFRCLLEEVHIALKILSKQHAKLQAFVERWAKFRTGFEQHLKRARISATKMQLFLNEFICVLVPKLEGNDIKLPAKKELCTEFLKTIAERQADVSNNKDNFDNYLATIRELREDLVLELQTLDGRYAEDEKIETLKRQLAQLKSELSRQVGVLSTYASNSKIWLGVGVASALGGIGVLAGGCGILGLCAMSFGAVAAFLVAELIAAGCIGWYCLRGPDEAAINKIEPKIAATQKELDSIEAHLAVEEQVSAVCEQLNFFARVWNKIFHNMQLLEGHFKSAENPGSSETIFNGIIAEAKKLYPVLARALDDYITHDSPLYA